MSVANGFWFFCFWIAVMTQYREILGLEKRAYHKMELKKMGWEMQSSNLTFEDNSQMASIWSRFTSHKCVSTSLAIGTCITQNSHFSFNKQFRHEM